MIINTTTNSHRYPERGVAVFWPSGYLVWLNFRPQHSAAAQVTPGILTMGTSTGPDCREIQRQWLDREPHLLDGELVPPEVAQYQVHQRYAWTKRSWPISVRVTHPGTFLNFRDHPIFSVNTPSGTTFYHRWSIDKTPIEFERLATDPEHSHIFCLGNATCHVTISTIRFIDLDGCTAAKTTWGTQDTRELLLWGNFIPGPSESRCIENCCEEARR